MEQFNKILKAAISLGASDVILKADTCPIVRLRGIVKKMEDHPKVHMVELNAWIDQILPENLRSRERAPGEDIDFSFENELGFRFRVNVFNQRRTTAVVLRIINNHIRSLEELQLPPVINQLCHEKRGLILVTGATGSGKSTTLASMIERINETRPAHIVTIEDPIEYYFKDRKATIEQREVGTDTVSFSRAVRSAMRQNPDVILIGELRDKETVETALMAAETGHLVLSTIHTNDAVETLTRILSFFEPHQHTLIRMMLEQSLRAIISQRLVRRTKMDSVMALCEILICNANIRHFLMNNTDLAPIRDAIESGVDTYGMQSFDQALLFCVAKGVITPEEAIMNATNRDDFLLKLQGVGK